MMAEKASFDERVLVVEDYLWRRAARASGCTSMMRAALYLFQHRGTVRIAELANHAAMSVRQLERGFAHEIGVAPKLFARVARFQMALDAKISSPGRSWVEIAHEFHYCDQTHMVRDFQSLSGSSPTRMLMELGDTRPSALAASRCDGQTS